MTETSKSKTAHSSASDIVNTFNTFFSSLPTNKSFDMTYKVYIRDLADVEDRGSISARSSSVNLTGTTPVTIASHGVVPTITASSTQLDQSLLSTLSTISSSTSLSSGRSGYFSDPSTVTTSQIERIYQDNQARKERSLVDLAALQNEYGVPYQPPPPETATPLTVYENLGILGDEQIPPSAPSLPTSSISSSSSSIGTSLTEVKRGSDTDCTVELFVRVSDCFD